MIADNSHAAPPVIVIVEPLLVGSAVAARVTGMSARSWQRLAAEGAVPAPIPFGRKRLWRLEKLREWVALGCPSRERFEALTASPAQAPPGIGRNDASACNRAGVGHRSPANAEDRSRAP